MFTLYKHIEKLSLVRNISYYFIRNNAKPGKSLMFSSYNFPKHFWGVRINGEAHIMRINGKDDQKFTIVASLCGDSKAVSIMTPGGFFLRHADYLFSVAYSNGTDMFNENASFFPRMTDTVCFVLC